MILRTSCLIGSVAAIGLVTMCGAAISEPGPATGPVLQAPRGVPNGYYRQPALHKDGFVFVAEGDLWEAGPTGGTATRLTSHPGDEARPAVSPDGQWVAFTGQYEGPTEVYVMPLHGGLPKRLTFDGARASVVGWTPQGRIMATTDKLSTLPNIQLTLINPENGEREIVPLSQASDGVYDESMDTLYFVRIPFNGSQTKRYKGGTIQQIWSFKKGAKEAVNLTGDYPGTSKRPMWWNGRVYFLSDRDDTMNVWSMTSDGKDLKQHTQHKGFDIQDASLNNGRIAYQLGADLWILDLGTGQTAIVGLTLNTDLDQMRERWIEKPMDYLTAAHISPDGEKVVLTARGRVFVAPAKQGRFVDVLKDDGVRYRAARFLPDGKGGASELVALSDKTGEVEVWTLPANGVGESKQVTTGSKVLKWESVPSPDGKMIAHYNKDYEVWVHTLETKTDVKIDTSNIDDYLGVTWSPDSQWLAIETFADNMFRVIKLWNAQTGSMTTVTSDRFDSYSPAWSTDGKWLYFLSDRTFRTLAPSPWGPNQPDPFLDETTKIYALGLKPETRWPFAPKDEVQLAKEKAEKEKQEQEKEKEKTAKKDEPKPEEKKDEPKKDEPKKDEPKKDEKKPKPIEITLDGIQTRIYEVPVKPGNYSNLNATDKALFWLSTDTAFERKNDLQSIEIKNEAPEVKTVIADVTSYEMSGDTKKLLVRKKDAFYVLDATHGPAGDLEKKAVNLGGWTLSIIPRHQWRAMYIESWRLMRDYFYDKDMHGVDWRGMLEKYMPLVERVTTRAELNDVIAQMVAELSALHTFVRGGDLRDGNDKIQIGCLGGVLKRDEAAGGYRITRIYQCEPDEPGRVSPLAKPEVNAKVGDVIEMINGTPTLSVQDPAMLLRQTVGKQVLIRIKPSSGDGFGPSRDAIIYPISPESETDLRYEDWEYSRRKMVEELGGGKIGYLHLRAMGGGDFANWVKGFYPVFNREGLIVDVRHNRGGNIDSWILGKLMRKAWFFWNGRVGNPPSWNMQYAFRGHMVALCNERTASDGEAFAEGFRRLGLGKVIGTRTWGGEIWLSSSNVLVDKGIASAAETGVYGPEGAWLIEGHGVDPDIVVDNPPHETFNGEDAQLKAAIEHLKKMIAEKPIPPANPPKKPNKSSEDNRP